MSAGKHTPGPWKAEWYFNRAELVKSKYGTTLVLGQECLSADLVLMAAAPELLNELEMAHRIILNTLALMTNAQKMGLAERNHQDGLAGAGATRYHERLAAIAKATGDAA